MIQTGWNLESVLAITDDVDSYVSDDLLDPDNYVRICSTKVRGQAGGEKVVSRRCNRHNKYGTYRLLKYVESVVTRYRGQLNYIQGSLWQYTVRTHAFAKSLVNAFDSNGTNSGTVNEASRMFLDRHVWKHFGEQNIDHPRIRVTYETMREMQGLPLSARAMDMGHADQETTDVHYASDSTSHALQDRRISQYQEQFVEDIQHYACRIVESVSLQALRDGINASHAERRKQVTALAEKLGVDEDQIIHILSPEAQTYIAICKDAAHPSWSGHENYLKAGQNCNFFNKCALCKQAVIFSEALPYIARRIIDLDGMRDGMSQMEWLGNYGDEWDAWHQVLADWSDRSQVAQAQVAAKSGQVKLPLLMRGAK